MRISSGSAWPDCGRFTDLRKSVSVWSGRPLSAGSMLMSAARPRARVCIRPIESATELWSLLGSDDCCHCKIAGLSAVHRLCSRYGDLVACARFLADLGAVIMSEAIANHLSGDIQRASLECRAISAISCAARDSPINRCICGPQSSPTHAPNHHRPRRWWLGRACREEHRVVGWSLVDQLAPI